MTAWLVWSGRVIVMEQMYGMRHRRAPATALDPATFFRAGTTTSRVPNGQDGGGQMSRSRRIQ